MKVGAAVLENGQVAGERQLHTMAGEGVMLLLPNGIWLILVADIDVAILCY